MGDVLPLRIFLASPGDLETERSAVRACVDEHGARREHESRVSYEIVEWNQTRGTARRAQEAINELIAECHFMIVLFKHDWGSEPGSPWEYTSGTEEELFTGLLELGQFEQPMRDIWLGFVADSDPHHRIVELRQHVINEHAMMFESLSDRRDLKTKLRDRLESWEALAGQKSPRHIDLMPSSGKDVLRAANLRLKGQKLIELGATTPGAASLKEAAVIGGPKEHLAYAQFLRRHGDLDSAYAETQKAIEYVSDGPLYSALAADAFSAQAKVLGAQHHYDDAIGRLKQALTLLVNDDLYTRTIRSRIHDELGLAWRREGNLDEARRNFVLALDARRSVGHTNDVCQSLVNLARLEVAAGDLATASNFADEVTSTLRDTPPSGLHANAETLMAQVRLRQGLAADGIRFAERAFSLNRQMANRHGEAISLLVLAQCYRAAGQRSEAERHARMSLELNESMSDVRGAEKAQWVLDHLDD